MSSSDFPDRDLRLERLGDRDGRRPAHLGEAAHVGSHLASTGSSWRDLAAYQALIDAVFIAPGATEWLLGLRRRFGMEEMSKNITVRPGANSDAIRTAQPPEA